MPVMPVLPQRTATATGSKMRRCAMMTATTTSGKQNTLNTSRRCTRSFNPFLLRAAPAASLFAALRSRIRPTSTNGLFETARLRVLVERVFFRMHLLRCDADRLTSRVRQLNSGATNADGSRRRAIAAKGSARVRWPCLRIIAGECAALANAACRKERPTGALHWTKYVHVHMRNRYSIDSPQPSAAWLLLRRLREFECLH